MSYVQVLPSLQVGSPKKIGFELQDRFEPKSCLCNIPEDLVLGLHQTILELPGLYVA